MFLLAVSKDDIFIFIILFFLSFWRFYLVNVGEAEVGCASFRL